MTEAFRLGGWGMYPTAIIGLVLVVLAVRYALAPDAARALVVRRLALTTFLVGCLGFVVGVMNSFMKAAEEPAEKLGNLVVGGVGESLDNISFALVLLVLAGIATTLGAVRQRDAAAELADPHVR